MTTGESLYEDENDELDEDYLDPSFLHTAAELYNNPDLYYEMQSQIEAAHTHGHPTPHPPPGTPAAMALSASGGYPVGRSEEDGSYFYDSSGGASGASRMRTLSGSYNMPLSVARQQYQNQPPWSDDYAAMADVDERDESGALSPRQYALLMQSMQEPLAMYASTLDSSLKRHQSGANLYDADDDEEDDDDLGFEDGLSFSGAGRGQRWRQPMSPGFAQGGSATTTTTTTAASGTGGYHQLRPGEFEVDQMMLYSPGRYNPSPNFTYPSTSPGITANSTGYSGGSRPAGPGPSGREHSGGGGGDGHMIMMRTPVPPPNSSEGYDDELEMHPAAFMSSPMGYTADTGGGGGGQPIHRPVPPPSRNRHHRPPTRPGF